MTKIRHYVTNITEDPQGFIIVIFREKVANETILKYIEEAKQDWKKSNMPGELPKELQQYLQSQRFKNKFEMHFPIHQWKQKELKINDMVDIDMPLTIDDVEVIKPEFDV